MDPYKAIITWNTHPNSGPFTLYPMAPSEEEERLLIDFLMNTTILSSIAAATIDDQPALFIARLVREKNYHGYRS